MLQHVLGHRSPAQCRERVRYVVFCLERRAVSTDDLTSPKCGEPATQTTPSTVAPHNNAFLRVKLMREEYNSRKQKLMWQGKCLTLQRKIRQLETKLNEVELEAERAQDESSNDDNLADVTLQDQLLSEMLFLSHKRDRERRYSEKLRDICQLLMLTSPRTYKLLHQFLPIPSREALRYHYSSSFSLIREMISDQNLIDSQVGILSAEIPENSMITIGMDAFSFRTFHDTSTLKTKTNSSFSDAFLFMHAPLDANLKTKVIHLQKKGNGSFDSSVIENFKKIAEIYRARRLKVMFMATDGDRF